MERAGYVGRRVKKIVTSAGEDAGQGTLPHAGGLYLGTALLRAGWQPVPGGFRFFDPVNLLLWLNLNK